MHVAYTWLAHGWSHKNNNKHCYCQVFQEDEKSVHEWITESRTKAYELSDGITKRQCKLLEFKFGSKKLMCGSNSSHLIYCCDHS